MRKAWNSDTNLLCVSPDVCFKLCHVFSFVTHDFWLKMLCCMTDVQHSLFHVCVTFFSLCHVFLYPDFSVKSQILYYFLKMGIDTMFFALYDLTSDLLSQKRKIMRLLHKTLTTRSYSIIYDVSCFTLLIQMSYSAMEMLFDTAEPFLCIIAAFLSIKSMMGKNCTINCPSKILQFLQFYIFCIHCINI